MPSKQYITSDHSLVNIFYIKERKSSEFHQYSTFIADFTYTLGNLPVSEYFTFNDLPLEFHRHLLISVAVFCNLQFGAASAALLTVQLPSALLHFVSLALGSLGVSSQIAHHGPEGFEPVQPAALAPLQPDLWTLRRAEGAEGAHRRHAALLPRGAARRGHGAQLPRVLHVPDDLAQVAGQVLAGEGEGFVGAAEGQRGRQGLGLRGGDGEAQGDGRAAVGHLLLVVVLGELGLRVGDDALWVAVPQGLGRAGLEGALQLHHVEGVLRNTEQKERDTVLFFSSSVIFGICLKKIMRNNTATWHQSVLGAV